MQSLGESQGNSNSSNERKKPTRDNSSSSSTDSDIESLINEDCDHELTSDSTDNNDVDSLETRKRSDR